MSHSESLFSFGPAGTLHGVLTEAAPAQRDSTRPAVLLWNVGLHHHVGPYRIYVDLARKLANGAFSSLRFDTSGLGDSETSRDDSRSDFERNIADVQEAMRALQRRGYRRFVLVGFCSSVDAAHSLGLRAPEVEGIVYLEGYGYRTPGFYLRFPLRLLSRERWERRLRLRFPTLFGEAPSSVDQSSDREQVFVRDYPTEHKLGRDVRKLVKRGVHLLWIYGGGDTVYLYRDQFFDFTGAAELASHVQVDFYPSADHTFFVVQDRERVLDRLLEWLTKTFPAQPERAAGPDVHEQAEARLVTNGV